MAGILIIAHTPLASALVACVTHIYNEKPARVGALDILPGDDPKRLIEVAREQATQLGRRRRGTLVMADLIGGTPTNIASELVNLPNVRVIAGVNLPMLVRTLCYRSMYPSMRLHALAEKAISGGMQGMQIIEPHMVTPIVALQENGYKNPCLLGVQN